MKGTTIVLASLVIAIPQPQPSNNFLEGLKDIGENLTKKMQDTAEMFVPRAVRESQRVTTSSPSSEIMGMSKAGRLRAKGKSSTEKTTSAKETKDIQKPKLSKPDAEFEKEVRSRPTTSARGSNDGQPMPMTLVPIQGLFRLRIVPAIAFEKMKDAASSMGVDLRVTAAFAERRLSVEATRSAEKFGDGLSSEGMSILT